MSALDTLLPRPEIAGWPTLLPDHLSPSSLKMWMRCREQWRRRYVLGEKERPGAALVWGSAHNFALVETNFAQKITSGEDLPVADVELAFAEGFDQRVAVDGDEIQWGDDKPGELKDRGVGLAAAYHRQVSPSVQPVSVEESFALELPGVPVPVIGRMDVAEEHRSIDLKTGGKREMRPDNVFQGRVYQLVRPLPMEFHLATKTKTPAIYTPPEWPEFGLAFDEAVQIRTRRVLTIMAQDILATYAQFGPEQTWPGAFTYGWACGFCGFKPTCAYWAGDVDADSIPFGGRPAGVSALAAAVGVPGGAVDSEGLGDSPAEASPVAPDNNLTLDHETGLFVTDEEQKLRDTIVQIGEATGKGEIVHAAIDRNLAAHPDDPASRITWLKAQLRKAGASAAGAAG